MKLNRDYSDLLSDFRKAKVRFLVVGAYALALHGRPRTTGDLDLWVDPARRNAARVFAALGRFGAPLEGLSAGDFEAPNVVFQIGVAPNRIDLLTSLTALRFADAWKNRRRLHYGSIPIAVLSAADLIRNKRALGRPRDLADVEEMKASGSPARPRRRG
jgi:hypothetical protein